MSSSIVQNMVWCNICDRKNDFVLCLISFHFHPSLSKRSGRSKGFGAGVTRGPDVEGAPTMASRRCSSRSLIFLIASTPRRVALKPDIRGRLVLLWFSASSRKRPSGAGVSTFVVSPCPWKTSFVTCWWILETLLSTFCSLFSLCCFSSRIYLPNFFISRVSKSLGRVGEEPSMSRYFSLISA